MALRIFGLFYAAMALAGCAIELVFTPLGSVPAERTAKVTDAGISWGYTTPGSTSPFSDSPPY